MYTRFQYNKVYSYSMYFDTANQISPQCNTQSVKIIAPSLKYLDGLDSIVI